ncbi:unnamed protein product, partial [Citrullus colocynthis]
MIRFEGSWLKFQECRDIINCCWADQRKEGVVSFLNKIKNCLEKLGKWSQNRLKGSLKRAILKKEGEIKALLGLDRDEEDRVLHKAKLELEDLLEEEEIDCWSSADYWDRVLRKLSGTDRDTTAILLWDVPLVLGSWKINTDASWSKLKGAGGIGWVVRDSSASIILAGCEK